MHYFQSAFSAPAAPPMRPDYFPRLWRFDPLLKYLSRSLISLCHIVSVLSHLRHFQLMLIIVFRHKC